MDLNINSITIHQSQKKEALPFLIGLSYFLKMYKRIINVLKNTGPGPLIAAAFIGPGTVTLCTISGAYYGMSLLWAVLFSILAAIILQEMSVRLGIITQKSIPQLLR